MSEKKFLERMGIIQRIEPEMSDDGFNEGSSYPQAEELGSEEVLRPAPPVAEHTPMPIQAGGVPMTQDVVRNSAEQRMRSTEQAAGTSVTSDSGRGGSPEPYFEPVERAILSHDKYTTIEELYKGNGLSESGANTVFIIDEFAKAMPNTLPADVRQQSVLKVLEISSLNTQMLVEDGLSRIENLNGFIGGFRKRTNELVEEWEGEISALEEKIKVFRRNIEERVRLQEKQETTIEYETHKVQEILDFVTKK